MSTVVFVCVRCGSQSGLSPGPLLADRLEFVLADQAGLRVERVECLSVCKRPATIALSAPGKWGYLFGDLGADGHVEHSVEDIRTMAVAYRDSVDGIVPWRERPASFRKGVIARLPPIPAARQPTREEVPC